MTEHVHRWIIDSPHGRKSIGHCDCGAVREFSNVFDDVKRDAPKPKVNYGDLNARLDDARSL